MPAVNAFSSSLRPIGVFDSGLGGLTVLETLRARLPTEDFIYFADTAHLPYGDKPEEVVRARSLAITNNLLERGAKAIVIACNTATAAAAESLRNAIEVPVIALEPAVKPAVSLSRRGMIGVLATTRTLYSRRFERLVQTHAQNARIFAQPCPALAEAIELEGAEGDTVRALLDRYVRPLALAEVDVVVLGCTHYLWVMPAIAARLPKEVKIVDSGEAVARQVEKRLQEESFLGGGGAFRLATSGDPASVGQTIQRLCGFAPDVEYWRI
ncbi:MAG: glutamate racemase [Betaproteobacteria bacterium]|nr:glutamate racemase [Betaproteobacteria bacterium]